MAGPRDLQDRNAIDVRRAQLAGMAGSGPYFHSDRASSHRTGGGTVQSCARADAPLHQHHSLLVQPVSLLHSAALVLAGTPAAGGTAGRDRCGSGDAGGARDGRLGQFPELPLSIGDHRCHRTPDPGLGGTRRRACVYPVRDRTRAELLRCHSFLLHNPSRAEIAAVDHLRQFIRISCSRIPCRAAHPQTPASWGAAQRCERRPRKPAGAARKHYSLDQQRPDYHGTRRADHAGQCGRRTAS